MKKFGRNFIQNFDLFAKPFSFFVGDKKNRSTLVGGILSLVVMGISIYYFYYLMNLYFSNKIQPKITENFKIENNFNNVQIREGFIIMEMLVNGQPLKQYEQQVNKIYLNYTINYEQYYTNGTSQQVSLPISQCTDFDFSGYLCIDQSAFQENLDIYSNPISQLSSDYAVQINLCDNTTVSNCATQEEIYELIFQPQNYFQIFTKIKQYNSNTRQFEDGYKSEYFYFDPYLITYTRMDLVVATTTLTQGMVFQANTQSDNIYNYQRVDTYFTKQGIQQRMGIDGLAYIVYELNQVHNYFQIQEPMLTEVLAQFMSIFNTLLIIGFLARLLAESHIVEDMNNILLKEYYKRTALRLVQRQQLKQVFQTIEKAEPSAQAQIIQSFNSQSKVHVLKEPSPEQQKSKLFVEMNKKIAETNFSEQLSKYFNLSIKDRIKHFICSIFARNHKVDEKKDPNSDPILYSNLQKQSLKRINIFEVYKDLIKIKMAIKLIMTKEQYAAMQFCGSEMCSEEQETKVDQNKEQLKIIEKSNATLIKPSPNNTLNILQKSSSVNQFQEARQSKRILSAFSKEKNYENNPEAIQKNKTSRLNVESHLYLPQNCQQHKTVVNHKFSNKNQQISKHLSDSEIFLCFPNDQQTRSSKNSIITTINTLRSIQQKSPKKQISATEEKVNIQNLKIFGDQNVFENGNLSSDSLEEQQQNMFQQNDLQNLQSHLVEMDKIESDLQEQEKYLNQFLIKIKNQKPNAMNPIDKHIFQSLLVNDQQPNKINNFRDLQNITLDKKLSIDLQPRLSKLLIDFQIKQNKDHPQII